MPSKYWTKEKINEVKNMVAAGMTNMDISKKLGKSQAAIQIIAFRYWGGNPNYRIQKTKHKHLRGPVMKYFVTHSAEETMKHFKLTRSEFKSILTIGYRLPEFAHLRKDTRIKREWKSKDYKFLLRHAGLMPRDWIASKLGRGGIMGIKDRLEKLGVSSRTLNGITLSQFREAFGKEPSFYLKTKAGPGRNETPTYFKIIPWVYLNKELREKRLMAPKVFCQLAATMALFQEWIFEGDALNKLIKQQKRALTSAAPMLTKI